MPKRIDFEFNSLKKKEKMTDFSVVTLSLAP